jgi:hypothetical protein
MWQGSTCKPRSPSLENHDLATISKLLPMAEPGVIETFNTKAE